MISILAKRLQELRLKNNLSQLQMAQRTNLSPSVISSYETGWQQLEAGEVTAPGSYSYRLEGLKPGVTYQYRAVLLHEVNTMRGEMNLFVRE